MSDAVAHEEPPSPPEPHYQPLVIVLLAVVVGILIDRFRPLSLSVWLIAVLLGWMTWLVLFLRNKNLLASFALLFAVATAAGAWHHCRWYLFSENDLSRYARKKAEPICLEVVALSSPRAIPAPKPDPMQIVPREECWRLDVEAVALRNGSVWQPVTGRSSLLVRKGCPAVSVGDRVRCYVKISAPPCPLNPGERDWAAFYRAERIRCRLVAEMPECLTVVKPGSRWTLKRLLENLRSHGRRMFQKYLDPRQAELASAVLLGYREEIDQTRSEAFLTSGTVHILSISGLHVGILAFGLFWLIRRLPIHRGWALAAIAVTTLLYAMMVDAEPPVVRATVLVLILCLALVWERQPLGMNSLAAAALVVLVLNPAHLFSVGAQLSFLCVAGLIWYAPGRMHHDDDEKRRNRTLDRLIMQNLSWPAWLWVKSKRSVIGLFLAGLLLWLLTFPLVTTRFHVLSLTALVLNVFLWIPMTFSVLFGFCVLLFGWLCWPITYVAYAFGFLCNACFFVMERLIEAADRFPYGHFWVPGFAEWWIVGFYGGLGLMLVFPRYQPTRRWGVLLFYGWLLVGFAPALWPRNHDRLDCTFLNMGHGCSVLMELPSGRTMLYDAGRLGGSSAGARTICECFWNRGIRKIDTVVLSHPDVDHYNALPGVMEKFSVGEVVVTPHMFQKDSGILRVLRNAIAERNIPLRIVKSGDRLVEDEGCVVNVLHPQDERTSAAHDDNTNAGSMVLAVEYCGRRILLPGDLESYGLAELLSRTPLDCDVLLAPHHGSRLSNSPELAEWCKPEWVVFSGDGRWSYPAIEMPYRKSGGQVLHTHDAGAIRIWMDANGLQIFPFVHGP